MFMICSHFEWRVVDHNTRTGRLFLAAVPDADTARRIHRLAEALKHAHQFDGRIVEAERLHVSLFFLGELPEPAARMACEAAAEVRAPPFEVCSIAPLAFEANPAINRSSSPATTDWTG